jgi:hypothetical protein
VLIGHLDVFSMFPILPGSSGHFWIGETFFSGLNTFIQWFPENPDGRYLSPEDLWSSGSLEPE